MFKNKGLSFKLSFYIIICCTLLFIVMYLYNYKVIREQTLKNVRENAENLTISTVNQIEKVLLGSEKIPKNLAMILSGSRPSETEVVQLLTTTVNNNDEIYGSCAAFEPYSFAPDKLYYAPYCCRSASGKDTAEVSMNYLGSKSYEYFYHDWYQVPRELERAGWTEPYYDEGGGNVVMSTYSVPFYETAGGTRKVRGIVTADISLDWLEKIVSSIKIYESGYSFIVSKYGHIVTHPNRSFIMNESIFSLAEANRNPDLAAIGRKMIKGESGFYPLKGVMLEQDCWIYFMPMPSIKWSLAVVFPENELLADMGNLNRGLATIAGIGLIIMAFIIVYIARRITRPLTEFTGVTNLIGKGDFDVKMPEINSDDEVGMLKNSFVKMQKALKEYIRDLKATTSAKEKIESELKIAHDIQMSIIPKMFPPYPDRPEIDLFGILEPAKEVGGDLYDFFFVDDETLCFAVGDVSGKGVPGSLFMAITRTLLRAKTVKGQKISEIVGHINNVLCDGNENMMFVTFFFGFLNVSTGVVEYCNAGHNPPYIIRENGAIEVLPKTKDAPLGIIERDFYVGSFSVKPGESVILFTDGVTEAVSADNKFYGEPRLESVITGTDKLETNELAHKVLADIKDFSKNAEQADDITILVVKYFGK